VADLPPWPQIYGLALLHVLLLLWLVYWLIPGWIWPFGPRSGPAGVLARAIWTVFAFGLLVHLMVVLRIYEGLTLLLLLAAGLWYGWRARSGGATAVAQLLVLFRKVYDWLHGGWRSHLGQMRQRMAASVGSVTWSGALSACAVVLPVGVAAWERFAQAVTRISPALSDAEVNLKWMRLLENSYSTVYLYVDGVYPMGMYTFLSLMRKLSALNPVVLLQVTGPLVGLGLVVLGAVALYIATGRGVAAAVFAWLYGTMAAWLPISLERQAAHNSQEFGMLFILPAVAFAIRYLLDGERWQVVAAAAAVGMTVLTHPVPAIYAVLGVGVSAVVMTLIRLCWRRCLALAGWCAAASVLAALPPAVGLALGIPWNGSSISYAAETVAGIPKPSLLLVLLAGVPVVFGLAGWVIVRVRRVREVGAEAAVCIALGVAALAGLAVTWAPALGVPIRFFYDRGRDPASMLLAAGVAAGVAVLAAPLLDRARWRWMAPVLLMSGMAVAWWQVPPPIAAPYRIFNDAMLYEYLRIDGAHAAGTWAMVAGPDAYTLALGRAQHIYPNELNTRYLITREGLTDLKFPGMPVPLDFFFFVDRQTPEGLPTTAERAVNRADASLQLSVWIQQALQSGLPLQRVYSDATLDVWELQPDR
jgi:hypothetical protein